jgi:hypothetical protein
LSRWQRGGQSHQHDANCGHEHGKCDHDHDHHDGDCCGGRH